MKQCIYYIFNMRFYQCEGNTCFKRMFLVDVADWLTSYDQQFTVIVFLRVFLCDTYNILRFDNGRFIAEQLINQAEIFPNLVRLSSTGTPAFIDQGMFALQIHHVQSQFCGNFLQGSKWKSAKRLIICD